jgi:alkanesulfonate monooxygenase SsuD/methylene tetrahydromethanopterin reductase-like flavin-dependent oxidoreductase (luciferase family)
MTAAANLTPAPVHQQVPPARAAASAPNSARRAARGSLPLMTGTACTGLDRKKDD